MAKSANQKLKLLYLMKILKDNTDEQHPMSVNEMIEALSGCGVAAERKSIYDDLELLSAFGLDIIKTRGRTTGYYVGAREFELPELRLLVDSVQSSKFITHKKTMELIGKLAALAGRHDAQKLQRQVYVQNRVKSMNESVYYNVDEISEAILTDRQIEFKYYEYTVSKEKRFRRQGARYSVSPFTLLWDDENYYMLAYEGEAGRFKHFRVDKMTAIEATDRPREGKTAFAGKDMSSYTKKVFGMFSGAELNVRLRFKNHLAGAVIDRFGKDVILTPDGEDAFCLTTQVAVSPQFLAWMFAFSSDAEVLSPESVRQQMETQLKATLSLYA